MKRSEISEIDSFGTPLAFHARHRSSGLNRKEVLREYEKTREELEKYEGMLQEFYHNGVGNPYGQQGANVYIGLRIDNVRGLIKELDDFIKKEIDNLSLPQLKRPLELAHKQLIWFLKLKNEKVQRKWDELFLETKENGMNVWYACLDEMDYIFEDGGVKIGTTETGEIDYKEIVGRNLIENPFDEPPSSAHSYMEDPGETEWD